MIENLIEEITKCPECSGYHIVRDYTRGELVCEECGLVVDEQFIDQGPEWRSFDVEQNEQRSRTGSPMTFTVHDKGLSTEIGWGNKDSYGRSIPSKNRAQLYRMRKWQHRTRISNSTDRNLSLALTEVAKLSSKMGLPRNVRETASMIYRKAVNKNLIRGRSVEGVAAAALYAACRQCGVPRTLNEIAQISRVGKKEIGRTYRFMSREIRLHLMPTSPEDYISRFCSELGVTGKVETKSLELIKQATEKELTSGRGPTGVSAATIYIASVMCDERRTQKQIGKVAGVTEVTVRNRYKELAEELGIEMNIWLMQNNLNRILIPIIILYLFTSYLLKTHVKIQCPKCNNLIKIHETKIPIYVKCQVCFKNIVIDGYY